MNTLKYAPIVRVYAGALWKQIAQLSASEQQDFVLGAKSLREFLIENREVFNHLRTVLVSSELRSQVFAGLCVKYKLPAFVCEFANFLGRKRRLEILPEVLNICMRTYREAQGILGVYLFSSVPASSEQKQSIESFLQAKFGKKVEFLAEEKLFSGYGILLKLESGGVFDWSSTEVLRGLRKRWLGVNFPLSVQI